MVSDYRKISVHNVPRFLPLEQMHDKLLIHFLRPRNGGGEVLELLYPTEEQGVALVTFELEEVAEAVLGRKHLLELDKQKFPLEVRRAADSRSNSSEAYMTVETTLDLHLFPDKNVVKALVEKYGFRFYAEADAKMRIKGVFPALKKLREELLVILRSESWAKKKYLPPSELAARPRTPREVDSPRKLEDYSSRLDSTTSGTGLSQGNASLYGTRMTYSTSPAEPASHPWLSRGTPSEHRPRSGAGHSSMIPGREASNASLTHDYESDQRKRNFLAELHSASSLERGMSSLDVGHSPSSRNPHYKPRISNITVDLDTLKYIQAFKKQDLDQILLSASVRMSVEEQGELGLVTLASNSSLATSVEMDRVCGEVSAFVFSTQQNLRTQDIPLSGASREKKARLTETSIKLASRYLTVTVSYDDRLHLIGPSQHVFLLKQTLMDLKEDTVHGETPKERLSGARARRDRSCPASREQRTVKNTSDTVDDRHSHGSLRSTGKAQEIVGLHSQQSPSNMVAATNDRMKRSLSLERKKSDEGGKMPIVPSHAGQNTDPSNSNLSERGREKTRGFGKRALKAITDFRPRK